MTAQTDHSAAQVAELQLAVARAEGRAATAEAAAAGNSEGEIAAQLSALRSQVRGAISHASIRICAFARVHVCACVKLSIVMHD